MPNKGRFVRRIVDSESEDDEVRNQNFEYQVDTKKNGEEQNQETSNNKPDTSSDDDDGMSGTEYDGDEEDITLQKDQKQVIAGRDAERIDRMEKMISKINDFLSRFDAEPSRDNDAEKSWNISNSAGRCESVGNTSSSIRWDHLKPFPSGIAANKMWEHWNRYVENFEIAASLSNVLDSAKRTQLLYLSMGSELQEITKAAKLRPNLSNPDCNNIFVSNIQKYLRSMTDSTAEHEAFLELKQENGESAVAFHARLMGKDRSCNYYGSSCI